MEKCERERIRDVEENPCFPFREGGILGGKSLGIRMEKGVCGVICKGFLSGEEENNIWVWSNTEAGTSRTSQLRRITKLSRQQFFR